MNLTAKQQRHIVYAVVSAVVTFIIWFSPANITADLSNLVWINLIRLITVAILGLLTSYHVCVVLGTFDEEFKNN